jgi:hypothetical protein
MARATLLRALLLACLLALAAALSWPGKGAAKADAAPAGGAKKTVKDVTKLSIGVKHRPSECERKAADGERVYVHYRGTLTDGEQFDASCACPQTRRCGVRMQSPDTLRAPRVQTTAAPLSISCWARGR